MELTHTPKIEKKRMNHILTSQTEPYDLSFSRSYQNLSHLPPSYEVALKPGLSKYCLKSLSSGRGHGRVLREEAAPAARHDDGPGAGPAPAAPAAPPPVQRAMSQDHVLSPEPTPTHGYGLSSYGGRVLSEEQLLSADRLHSQDPLLSPDGMLSLKRANFREKAMSRALSHTDMFMPTTPVMDRYKMTKMHSHPSPSNEPYNTLTVNHNQTASKRQAFASRRTHTVDHLQYIPGHAHHYRTASKTEVTV
ncbi:hypothetical protein AAFF_G00123260 [Aldrovandia affinis]|uniref:Uncharacterized protein n=1 Tax=Aldrovandia affinis TaxID=143900 RepID=A0AAD7RS06_9TELE|nr:hypothetical protein AAFF_G00123260 [Aldrovandia affinis]